VLKRAGHLPRAARFFAAASVFAASAPGQAAKTQADLVSSLSKGQLVAARAEKTLTNLNSIRAYDKGLIILIRPCAIQSLDAAFTLGEMRDLFI
jgi:hypothetical protein